MHLDEIDQLLSDLRRELAEYGDRVMWLDLYVPLHVSGATEPSEPIQFMTRYGLIEVNPDKPCSIIGERRLKDVIATLAAFRRLIQQSIS